MKMPLSHGACQEGRQTIPRQSIIQIPKGSPPVKKQKKSFKSLFHNEFRIQPFDSKAVRDRRLNFLFPRHLFLTYYRASCLCQNSDKYHVKMNKNGLSAWFTVLSSTMEKALSHYCNRCHNSILCATCSPTKKSNPLSRKRHP